MSVPLWGVDLGGTKIEAVILRSFDNPAPIIRKRIDTNAVMGYGHILKQIDTLIGMMKKESGMTPQQIGFGTPGVLDPQSQTMKNCNTTSLNGRPLKKDLESLLRVPAIIANDANCFALAETHWGIVKQKFLSTSVVFGIIMGSGVGGGIVLNGKVWNGRHGIAGEWGHNFLDESGGPCYCGKTGCVETIISGTALQKFYAGITGENIPLKEIVNRSAQHDEAALRTVDRLQYFFGKAVSVVINLVDPDVIVVGGGVGNIDSIYKEGVVSLKKFIFNNRVEVPIIKPALGDSAGVFGAAALTAT